MLIAKVYRAASESPAPPALTMALRRPITGAYTFHVGHRAGEVVVVGLFTDREAAETFGAGALAELTRDVGLRFSAEDLSLERVAACRLDRPLAILSAPRSGSTLFFELLAKARAFHSLHDESNYVIDSIPSLHARSRGYDSHRLDEQDATDDVVSQLRLGVASGLRDRDGRWLFEESKPPEAVRFLEKTPRNALRVPFVRRVFPGTRFVFLWREPRENVSSIIDIWRRPDTFTSIRDLPGWPAGESWPAGEWRLLLPPGWRSLVGRPLVEVAVKQYTAANEVLLESLAQIPSSDFRVVRYSDLISRPAEVVRAVAEFADFPIDEDFAAVLAKPLAPSSRTFGSPHPDKWKKNAALIEPYSKELDALAGKLAAFGSTRSIFGTR
jgi:hypothetical protein